MELESEAIVGRVLARSIMDIVQYYNE